MGAGAGPVCTGIPLRGRAGLGRQALRDQLCHLKFRRVLADLRRSWRPHPTPETATPRPPRRQRQVRHRRCRDRGRTAYERGCWTKRLSNNTYAYASAYKHTRMRAYMSTCIMTCHYAWVKVFLFRVVLHLRKCNAM